MILTPEIAGWMLQFGQIDEQRKLNIDTVQKFGEMMIGGIFEEEPPITFQVRDRVLKLANGKHRLAGIIFAGKAVKMGVEFLYV